MLAEFRVDGFKCFGEQLIFALNDTSNYEFNSDAVKNGIVNKGLIYGFNGCGKSNLGLALFDIVSHLTDQMCEPQTFTPYLNLNNESKSAFFEYKFLFHGKEILYKYRKQSLGELLWESLWIDGREVVQYDFLQNKGEVGLAGTETLDINASESKISRVKYIKSNAILPVSPENALFVEFLEFVDQMLLFYSLERTNYVGFKTGVAHIGAAIVGAGKTKDFERFLKNCNVDLELSEKEIDGEPALMVHYKKADVSFYRVASSGTRSLALFFYWYMQMEKASFVFMDEFDAFYHFELSEYIVELLKGLKDTQILFTTHNTDLLSNDLLRPDCFFWMEGNQISPLSSLTEKELRKAHNLQKMFKAGAFNA